MLGHLGCLGLVPGGAGELEEGVDGEAGREVRSVLGRGEGDPAHPRPGHRPQERGVGARHVGERRDRGHALRRSAGPRTRAGLGQTLIGCMELECVFHSARSEISDLGNTKHFHCFSPSSEPINHGGGTNHGRARTNTHYTREKLD